MTDHILVFVGLLISSLALIFIIFFIIARQRQNHLVTQQQAMKQEFEKQLLRTRLEIQEHTLKNISQEIHDNIGQVLSLAKLNLATTDIKMIETAQQKIDDSKNLVAKAIQDLRDLSKSLNTDYVADMGLLRSIEYELEMIKKTGSLDAVLDIDGHPYKLEQQKELILFRIVQEVLNNIIKHARASQITVKIDFQTGLLCLKVIDNGQGFHLEQIQEGQGGAKPGLGIKNIHDRAMLISAQFSIASIVGEGTTVSIQLPVLP